MRTSELKGGGIVTISLFHCSHVLAAAVRPCTTDTCFSFLLSLVTLADAMRSLDVFQSRDLGRFRVT